MIILSKFMDLLASGEFSLLNLTKTALGTIDESEYAKVIGHINLGVKELHKRFKFLEAEVQIYVSPSVTKYCLEADRFALEAHLSDDQYLLLEDDDDGYINIIEIKQIYDADNVPLKMWNRHATPAIKQLAPTQLKITGLTAAEIWTIVYQAYPTNIAVNDDLDVDNCVIDIPVTAEEALLYYVAARVFQAAGQNNSSDNADKSSKYQQQFELASTKIDIYGLDIEEDDKINRFESKGWA